MVETDEIFISHDVIPLFTKTPVEVTSDIIQNCLRADRTLQKRTNLTVDDIAQLLRFVATFPVQRENIQTEGGLCDGGSTVGYHEWIFHGRSRGKGYADGTTDSHSGKDLLMTYWRRSNLATHKSSQTV